MPSSPSTHRVYLRSWLECPSEAWSVHHLSSSLLRTSWGIWLCTNIHTRTHRGMHARYIMDERDILHHFSSRSSRRGRRKRGKGAICKWLWWSSVYGGYNGEWCWLYQWGRETTQWSGRAGRQMGRERDAAGKGRLKIVGAHNVAIVYFSTTYRAGDECSRILINNLLGKCSSHWRCVQLKRSTNLLFGRINMNILHWAAWRSWDSSCQ